MNPELFKNPSKEFRPSPFWSWAGKLEPSELKRQVRLLKSAGYGGYFMHARIGMETKYLGKEWFSAVSACLSEGKKMDMESWIYDEDMYPSGSAGGLMDEDWMRAQGLQLVEGRMSEIVKELSRTDVLAAFAVSLNKNDTLKSFRRIYSACKLSGNEKLMLAKVSRIEGMPEYSNGAPYVDLLNPAVTEKFLEITLSGYIKRYKSAFGEFMPGSFTDEPKCVVFHHQVPFTPALPGFFRSLHGYSVTDRLPLLFFKGEGSFKLRYDYWKAVTKRLVEAFTIPYAKFCEKHGLLMTGHYNGEENLLEQAKNVGSMMAHYEHMQLPGVDHLGNNIYDMLVLKAVSSVAHQFGRKRALSEIFGGSGNEMTFADQKWAADLHFALGVPFLCQHLLCYTFKGDAKRDYPPSFSYQQPYFKDYKLLNDYFARASYITSQGSFKADCLLLHPVSSAWGLFQPGLRGKTREEMNKETLNLSSKLESLVQKLMGIHVDFDFGDETILAKHGSADEGLLRVAKSSYKLVIVPPSVVWSKATAELLEKFLCKGGKVVFYGRIPEYVEGLPDKGRWERMLRRVNVYSCSDAKALKALMDKLLPEKIRVTDSNGQELEDIFVHNRIEDNRHIMFFSNKSKDKTYNAVVSLPFRGRAEEYGLLSGEVTPMASAGKGVKLNLGPNGSRAIVIDASKKPVLTSTKAKSGRTVLNLKGPWQFKRLDQNILVLDTCRMNGKVLPVYKARKEILARAGLLKYAGMQPWAIKEKKIPYKTFQVELEFGFEIEKFPGSLFLLLETNNLWKLSVNGKKVSTKSGSWYFDKCLAKIDIRRYAKQGWNTVKLNGSFTLGLSIEDLFLIGDFGVKALSKTKYVISSEPTVLGDESWVSQGYPFYCGSMLYRKEIYLKNPKGRFELSLCKPEGTVFFACVNGRRIPVISQPWRADITGALKAGKNTLGIEVVSSLRNAFGPLHNGSKTGNCVSPNDFENEKRQKPEYVLFPYGIGEVEIRNI